jgi:HEAT repeat protein
MRHLTRARVVEAAPEIIEALQDPSREVRACAAESLGSMSGLSPRFDPGAPVHGNDEAVAMWRAWWNGRRASSGTGGDGSPATVR